MNQTLFGLIGDIMRGPSDMMGSLRASKKMKRMLCGRKRKGKAPKPNTKGHR